MSRHHPYPWQWQQQGRWWQQSPQEPARPDLCLSCHLLMCGQAWGLTHSSAFKTLHLSVSLWKTPPVFVWVSPGTWTPTASETGHVSVWGPYTPNSQFQSNSFSNSSLGMNGGTPDTVIRDEGVDSGDTCTNKSLTNTPLCISWWTSYLQCENVEVINLCIYCSVFYCFLYFYNSATIYITTPCSSTWA